MKKLVLFMIAIFTSILMIGQDTTYFDTVKNQTVNLDIRVKSDPTSVVISTKSLDQNVALKKTLEVVHYQNLLINDNLENLIRESSKEKHFVDRRTVLDKYGLDILNISRQNQKKDIAIFASLFMLLSTFIFYLGYVNPLTIPTNYKLSLYAIKLILYPITVIMLINTISAIWGFDHYLFQTMIKLF